MAQLKLVMPPFQGFPYRKWNPVTRLLCDEYRANSPSPHIYLADFLEDNVARAVAGEFPGPAAPAWSHYKHQNEDKQGTAGPSMFPGTLGRLVDELTSAEFAEWLSDLTGIRSLIPDSTLDAAGMHRAGRGEFSGLHANLPALHSQTNWSCRVNLILYLTPDWRDEWGGALEFWSTAKCRVASYPSLFNHAVISNTDDRSLQGFQDPMQCPEKVQRNSLVLHYYTVENKPRLMMRSTDRRKWPLGGRKKTALFWLSPYVLGFWSRIKNNLHLT